MTIGGWDELLPTGEKANRQGMSGSQGREVLRLGRDSIPESASLDVNKETKVRLEAVYLGFDSIKIRCRMEENLRK